jgi:6-phosphogluconolactonase
MLSSISKFLMFSIVLMFSLAASAADTKFFVFVGNGAPPTKNSETPHGEIYVCELDITNGKLTHLHNSPSIKGPGFLEVHPSGDYLYAVGSSVTSKTGKGVIAAYKIDRHSGQLTFINEQDCGGQGPCHVTIDQTGKYAMLANYGSGGTELIPINIDGSLASPSCYIQHSGNSMNPERQKGPHAHSVNMDPTNTYCLVADLGLDKVFFYKLDRENNKLIPAGDLALPPGSGPRHLAFHPSGKFFFVNNELLNTVSLVSYQADPLKTEILSTTSTLPADWKQGGSTAETRVSQDGNFVFVSNRGHNSIAVLNFDGKANLKLMTNISSKGEVPRNFNLDPTGKFMIIGNQKTNNVVLYSLEASTLNPTLTGDELKLNNPICIRFLPQE